MRRTLKEITLLNGTKITVKAPLVKDLKEGANDVQASKELIAACCELSAEEVDNLELKDFLNLQKVLEEYMSKK